MVNVLLVFHWELIEHFLEFVLVCLSLCYDGKSKCEMFCFHDEAGINYFWHPCILSQNSG